MAAGSDGSLEGNYLDKSTSMTELRRLRLSDLGLLSTVISQPLTVTNCRRGITLASANQGIQTDTKPLRFQLIGHASCIA